MGHVNEEQLVCGRCQHEASDTPAGDGTDLLACGDDEPGQSRDLEAA